jgi:hypothetical protein
VTLTLINQEIETINQGLDLLTIKKDLETGLDHREINIKDKILVTDQIEVVDNREGLEEEIEETEVTEETEETEEIEEMMIELVNNAGIANQTLISQESARNLKEICKIEEGIEE